MYKNFQQWHKVKAYIDEYHYRQFYGEREIWWCSMGINIGTELHGKGTYFSRPVLIIRSFGRNSFLSIPITTKIKNTSYHCAIDLHDGLSRMCVLSQVRYFDSKRLLEKIGTVDIEQFQHIRQKVIELIQQPFVHPPSEPSEGEAEAKDAGNPAIESI